MALEDVIQGVKVNVSTEGVDDATSKIGQLDKAVGGLAKTAETASGGGAAGGGIKGLSGAFDNLGRSGSAALAQILNDAVNGNLTGLATLMGGPVAGSVVTATKAFSEFIGSQDRAIVSNASLAKALGTTPDVVQGISESLNGAGVSTRGFERLVNMMSRRVTDDYSSMMKNIRTDSDTAASASLRLQEAQEKLQISMGVPKETFAAQDKLMEQQRAQIAVDQAQEAVHQQALKSIPHITQELRNSAAAQKESTDLTETDTRTMRMAIENMSRIGVGPANPLNVLKNLFDLIHTGALDANTGLEQLRQNMGTMNVSGLGGMDALAALQYAQRYGAAGITAAQAGKTEIQGSLGLGQTQQDTDNATKVISDWSKFTGLMSALMQKVGSRQSGTASTVIEGLTHLLEGFIKLGDHGPDVGGALAQPVPGLREAVEYVGKLGPLIKDIFSPVGGWLNNYANYINRGGAFGLTADSTKPGAPTPIQPQPPGAATTVIGPGGAHTRMPGSTMPMEGQDFTRDKYPGGGGEIIHMNRPGQEGPGYTRRDLSIGGGEIIHLQPPPGAPTPPPPLSSEKPSWLPYPLDEQPPPGQFPASSGGGNTAAQIDQASDTILGALNSVATKILGWVGITATPTPALSPITYVPGSAPAGQWQGGSISIPGFAIGGSVVGQDGTWQDPNQRVAAADDKPVQIPSGFPRSLLAPGNQPTGPQTIPAWMKKLFGSINDSSGVATMWRGGSVPGFASGGKSDPDFTHIFDFSSPASASHAKVRKEAAQALLSSISSAGNSHSLEVEFDTGDPRFTMQTPADRNKIIEAYNKKMTELAKKEGRSVPQSNLDGRAAFTGFMSGGSAPGFAAGAISGPGTGTSDSILARLSHGEFVMKAASVQAYGEGFMNAVNNMQIPPPKYAHGGMIPASSLPRFAEGGGIEKDGSILNLHIGNESFNGLKAPAAVADQLRKFSIGQQTSSTGKKPSWAGG